jgi:hypothetical protein
VCLLTFVPADVMPDTTALHNGAQLNDDGHGFAIVAGDQLIVERGLDGDLMIEAFAAARRAHPHGPALFHSRFGTHGTRVLDNCHPFPIGCDPRTVMAHNGVLPAVVQPAKGDPRSDTRIAAEDYLPLLGSLRVRRNRMRLQRWMTSYNKIVILTVDRRFKQSAYILNEKAGIWDDGIWYSNDGYRSRPSARWGRVGAWDWPDEAWDDRDYTDTNRRSFLRCDFCYAIVDLADPECRYCGYCFDCAEMPEQCQCYAPAQLDLGPRT